MGQSAPFSLRAAQPAAHPEPSMNLRTPAALILSIALASPFALAQNDAPPKSPPPTVSPFPPTPRPDGPSSGPILSVEFPGGTAKEFVEAVRKAAGTGRVNVIVPREAESVPIPAVSLRDVSAYTALQSLQYALLPDSGNQFRVERIGKVDETSATFAVQFSSRNLAQANPQLKLETHVLSIHDLIDAPKGLDKDPSMVTSAETILNAIKAASQLDVDARIAPPEIMFHKDSELLIIRGTGDQLRTLETVVGQLRFSLESRRNEAASAADREKAARLQTAELQAQIILNDSQAKMAEADVERTTSNYNRISELVKAGQVSTTDLENARSEAQKARAMRDQATAAERNLKERQALLEARAQAGGGPAGMSGSGEIPVLVIYDYSDLEPFAQDVRGIMVAVVKLHGAEVDMKHNVDGRGTLSLRATPAEHAVIVKALNAMRRAKANEPKLPGLEAEDLIRKSREK
jgi:hypothetical protein